MYWRFVAIAYVPHTHASAYSPRLVYAIQEREKRFEQ
jgi:hypothetical protein